jgi:sulfate-transporting ATPase
VFENIRVANDARGIGSYLADMVRPGRTHMDARGWYAIRELRLDEYLQVPTAELPYGVRKRVAIGRAIAANCAYLLLDEPGAGLSAGEHDELSAIVRQLAASGIGVLLVEHDVGFVLKTCDEIAVLDSGRVIATGTPDEIRRDPRVIAAYLGSAATDVPGPVGVPTDGSRPVTLAYTDSRRDIQRSGGALDVNAD